MRLCLFASSKSTPTRLVESFYRCIHGTSHTNTLSHATKSYEKHTTHVSHIRKTKKYVCDFPPFCRVCMCIVGQSLTQRGIIPCTGVTNAHAPHPRCYCWQHGDVILTSVTFDCMQLVGRKKKQQFVGCVCVYVCMYEENMQRIIINVVISMMLRITEGKGGVRQSFVCKKLNL